MLSLRKIEEIFSSERHKASTLQETSTLWRSADLNADTFADLVLVNYQSNSIEIQIGDGSGRFLQTQIFTPTEKIPQVAVADFNGDGRPIWPSGAKVPLLQYRINSLYRGTVKREFVVSQTLETGFFQEKLTPIDLSGNGNIDLVVLTSLGNTTRLATVQNNFGVFVNHES